MLWQRLDQGECYSRKEVKVRLGSLMEMGELKV